MLIFFGAEFTKVYTYKKGYKVILSKHARWTPAKLYADSLKQMNGESNDKA
jgi:membrane protein